MATTSGNMSIAALFDGETRRAAANSALTAHSLGARRRAAKITLSDLSEAMAERGLLVSTSTLSRFETGKCALSDDTLAALDDLLPQNSIEELSLDSPVTKLAEVVVPSPASLKRHVTESTSLINSILEFSRRLIAEASFDTASSLLKFAKAVATAAEDQIACGWIDYHVAECKLNLISPGTDVTRGQSGHDEVMALFRKAFHSTESYVGASQNHGSPVWLSALVLRATAADAIARIFLKAFRKKNDYDRRKDLQSAFLVADETFERVRKLMQLSRASDVSEILARLTASHSDLLRTVEPLLVGPAATGSTRPAQLLRSAIDLQMSSARSSRSVDKLDMLATYHRKLAELLELSDNIESKTGALWNAMLARQLCISADQSLDTIVESSRSLLLAKLGDQGESYFKRLETELQSCNLIGCIYSVNPPAPDSQP